MGQPDYDITRRKDGTYAVWYKDVFPVVEGVTEAEARAAVERHAATV